MINKIQWPNYSFSHITPLVFKNASVKSVKHTGLVNSILCSELLVFIIIQYSPYSLRH